MNKNERKLLSACQELLQHAEWMGCPIGYSPRDFDPMFERAEAAIEVYKPFKKEANNDNRTSN